MKSLFDYHICTPVEHAAAAAAIGRDLAWTCTTGTDGYFYLRSRGNSYSAARERMELALATLSLHGVPVASEKIEMRGSV